MFPPTTLSLHLTHRLAADGSIRAISRATPVFDQDVLYLRQGTLLPGPEETWHPLADKAVRVAALAWLIEPSTTFYASSARLLASILAGSAGMSYIESRLALLCIRRLPSSDPFSYKVRDAQLILSCPEAAHNVRWLRRAGNDDIVTMICQGDYNRPLSAADLSELDMSPVEIRLLSAFGIDELAREIFAAWPFSMR